MGYFLDRSHPPTTEEVRSALGSLYTIWKRIIHFVENFDRVENKWSFWGPEKTGWNLRYYRKGKAMVALYPGYEEFIVNVVLGADQAEGAFDLKLGEKVSQLLKAAPQLRDGRWLFIPVLSDGDAGDVEQLLLLKMELL